MQRSLLIVFDHIIEKRIRKRQFNQGNAANFSFKINGKTGRSWWKKFCYWLILQKGELTSIFCRNVNFLHIIVYLFSQMRFKRKFCVYLILWNRPIFAKFMKKKIHTKINTLKIDIPQISIRWSHQKLRIPI